MAKTAAIGVKDYAKLIEEQNFYVDKTELPLLSWRMVQRRNKYFGQAR